MSYTVVSAKIDPQTKKAAMATADELGMPLSVVIKAFLKQFIRTKTVTFSAAGEKPSKYLLQAIKQAKEDLKTGKASPTFNTGKEAIKWLEQQGI